ncbi:hypothetical protein AAG570_007646 [Ranatra chinensis]|uniref:Uncharacterized protein n=1 Tax=Ranatra chinensis TaxID=642074 RepID=A0ABD0XVF4_9HEMI
MALPDVEYRKNGHYSTRRSRGQRLLSRRYNTYTWNETAHTERVADEILSVVYEDGKWSKPYYDCGGGNIWMLTYTVPFFGFSNDSYFFKRAVGMYGVGMIFKFGVKGFEFFVKDLPDCGDIEVGMKGVA